MGNCHGKRVGVYQSYMDLETAAVPIKLSFPFSSYFSFETKAVLITFPYFEFIFD